MRVISTKYCYADSARSNDCHDCVESINQSSDDDHCQSSTVSTVSIVFGAEANYSKDEQDCNYGAEAELASQEARISEVAFSCHFKQCKSVNWCFDSLLFYYFLREWH